MPLVIVDATSLHNIAVECKGFVKREFGRELNWEVDSLVELDEVCAQLLANGPLFGERLHRWWRLIGAYIGEVIVRAYGGEWIEHEDAAGAYAVAVGAVVGFPFTVADRVLNGEPAKSLATFGRAYPSIAAP
jgi:hypothetical protein